MSSKNNPFSKKSDNKNSESDFNKNKQSSKFIAKKITSVIDPNLKDEQAIKTLTPLKAITIYGAAKVLGVRASLAVKILKNLENKGLLNKVGGTSGRHIYSISKNNFRCKERNSWVQFILNNNIILPLSVI